MSVMQGKEMECSSVDEISSLQDEMLAKILSFLPTKQAASTSLVSRRWRNLFPLMNLLFASQHHYCFDDSELLYPQQKKGKREKRNRKNCFTDFVDKTLSLSGGNSSIKKFSLKCRDKHLCFYNADRWIHKALELGVVDFELLLAQFVNLLPPSIFTNKTLVKLTLEFCKDPIRLEKVCLPVLKSLVLHTNRSLGTFLYDLMLPGCPILEELALHYKRRYTRPPPAQDVWISHKTLKRLTIHDHNCTNDGAFKKFHTPSLVYFDYSGFARLINYSTTPGFTASLVEAKLDFRRMQYDYLTLQYVHVIIEGMRNIKSLSLSKSSVEMIMLWSKKEFPLFMNLVKLSLETNKEDNWRVLQLLLNKSPKLQTLVLRGFHCVGNQGICIDPNEVKVLEIYGFRASNKEVRQVKCLLSQMQFLQVMKVEIIANAADKRRFITRDLLAPPKRSSDFQILFL